MHKTQQLIVLLGFVLIFIMGIFPPWVFVDENKVGQPMGYAPIWKPPVERHQESAEFLGIKLKLDLHTQTANTIDFARLLVQIAIVFAVTSGAVVLAKKAST